MAGEGNPFGRILMPTRVMPHRVDLRQAQDVVDDAGGRINQAATVRADVPCWVQDLSADERLEFARDDLVYTTRVVFFQDPGPLTKDDVIAFGRRALRVKGVTDGLGLGKVWTAMCEEIT
jgi:hypothetical protein